MICENWVDIVPSRALRCKVAAGAEPETNHLVAFGFVERRGPVRGRCLQRFLQFFAGQIKRVRLQRAVITLCLSRDRGALIVIVGDVLDPLVSGSDRSLIDDDQIVLAQVIEQRRQLLLEQRQPVLHPGETATIADSFVQWILRRIGAEHFPVAAPETLDAVLVEERFTGGEQQVRIQSTGAHLGIGIESAQRFKFIAEEVQPQCFVHAAGEDIDNRPANGIFALVDDRVGAAIPLFLQQQPQAFAADFHAGFELSHTFANAEGAQHALQYCIGCGDDELRLGLAGLQAKQCRQPSGADRERGAGAVVRQRVPGGKFDDLELGREKRGSIDDRAHRRIVRRNENRAARTRSGEIGHDKRLSTACDLRQGEGSIGFQDAGKVGHRGPGVWGRGGSHTQDCPLPGFGEGAHGKIRQWRDSARGPSVNAEYPRSRAVASPRSACPGSGAASAGFSAPRP